jgi:hypothetical protein
MLGLAYEFSGARAKTWSSCAIILVRSFRQTVRRKIEPSPNLKSTNGNDRAPSFRNRIASVSRLNVPRVVEIHDLATQSDV